MTPPPKRFHIICTSAFGPTLESFETEEDRDEWCKTQDDTFETYFAVDGIVDDVYSPCIGV